MANITTTILSLGSDGKYSLPDISQTDISRVDVFDVDLILTDKNGNRYVLPNAAVDAMGSHPVNVLLSGKELTTADLLQKVGVTVDVNPDKVVPTSERLDANQEHKDKQDLEKAKKEKEVLEKKLDKLEHEIENQKNQPEKEVRHDKAESLTTNTEGAVEQLVKEAARIQDNLHSKDYDYTPTRLYTPPPSPITAADGVPAPLSMTPFVSITIGNMVGTTTSGSTIYGGGGAIGTGADALLGPRDPLQFSPATITGSAASDIIYSSGSLVGNADPSINRSYNAKQIVLNIAGYFTSLQDIRIEGVPAGVSVLGATNGGGGVWSLSSSYGASSVPFSIVYDMDSWRSGSNTFDLLFTVAGEGAKGQFFNTTQTFRFMYMDVTDVSQVTDNALVYDYKGQTKQIYVLPTMDQPNIIDSRDGDDQIYAGRNADIITVGNGNNLIYAYQGNDSVTTGTGNNTVSVGAGTNSVTLGNGANSVTSGAGDDTISSGTGSLTVNAGDGTNSITTAASTVNIITGTGNDTLIASSGSGTVDVGNGTNSITIGNGTSNITSGSGDDTIVTGSGTVTINAGGGANTVTTNGATVSITTGTGNDTISAVGGSGTVNAGDGVNAITVTTGNFSITSGVGADTVTAGSGNNIINVGEGNNTVHAGNGNNVITGGAGNDSFSAGNGDNIFKSGLGTNIIAAGTGNNTIDYTLVTTTAVVVSLVSRTATGTGLSDSFTGIENVTGSALNDTITGDALSNTLSGDVGNDIIIGGGGNDTLYGGDGNDTITGNTGNDIIYTGNGDNTVYTGVSGADFIYGGTGNNTFISQHAGVTYNGTNNANLVVGAHNTIDYSADTAGMTIDLRNGTGVGGLANGDVYVMTPANGQNSINGIIAGSGNDTITDSNSDDIIRGGNGNNVFRIYNGTDVVYGGANDDLFYGYGTGTKTYIGGNGGSNQYFAGLGYERFDTTGGGWDNVSYENSRVGVLVNIDTISHSVLNSLGGTITLAAQSGGNWGITAADTQSYSTGDTYTAGIDRITGSSYNDVIFGTSTYTDFYVVYGTDFIFGGSADEFFRITDNDRFDGGGGAGDTVYAQSGTNMSIYLDGAADINANGIADYLDKGLASLTISAANSPTGAAITYTGFGIGGWWGGQTYLKNIENILGDGGNDLLVGNSGANYINGENGNNSMYGLDGDDRIYALAGNNTIDGGAGTDSVCFLNDWHDWYGAVGVQVLLADASFVGASDKFSYWGAGYDIYQSKTSTGSYSTITNVENIIGGHLDDVLYGNGSANIITANNGNDIIAGNGGADYLYGNNGNDTFYATSAQLSTTVLYDGGAGSDTLKVSGLSLTAGSITGSKFSSIEALDIRNSAGGGSYTMNANDITGLADAGTSSSLTLKLDSGDTFSLAVGAGTGALSYLVASTTATDTIYYLYSDAGHAVANATNRVAILDVYTGTA